MDRFRLKRADGFEYRFLGDGAGGKAQVFHRLDDPRLTIAWDVDWGWCAHLPDGGALAGLSFATPPADQGATPPEGPWISRKGGKSYVYTLIPETV